MQYVQGITLTITTDGPEMTFRWCKGWFLDGSEMALKWCNKRRNNNNWQMVSLQRWVGLGLVFVNKLKPSYNHLKNR